MSRDLKPTPNLASMVYHFFKGFLQLCHFWLSRGDPSGSNSLTIEATALPIASTCLSVSTGPRRIPLTGPGIFIAKMATSGFGHIGISYGLIGKPTNEGL